MKKVFLLIGSSPRSLINFRGDLIDRLLEAGFDVHVAAPFSGEKFSVRDELQEKGCFTHEIRLNRTGINPVSDISTLLSLFSVFLSVRPSHVLAYTIKPVIYGLLVARFFRVKNRFALITGLGYAFSQGRSGPRIIVASIARILYRISLKGCSTIFFQNPDDRDVFIENNIVQSNGPVRVVNGSGVNLERFPPSSVPGNPSFLMVGRLLKSKGVREYAEAAMTLKARYPAVDFSLVGWLDDNPDSIAVRDLRHWVSHGLNYLGKMDDVRPAYSNCSVFVLPSYGEGTPRTVLEAMATGRAIVTTNAPGCRETVVNGVNGFIVPVGNVEDLAIAMERYILEPGMAVQHGRESLQIAVDRYDVHKVNTELLSGMSIFP